MPLTAEQICVILGQLPKEQRFDAGERIKQKVKAGYRNIRLFDRIQGAEPGGYTMHDLIAERTRDGETVTEFLFRHDGL